MPWCPNCRTEYRPGFHKCSDCGASLVETLPPKPKSEPEPPLDAGSIPVVEVDPSLIRQEYATLVAKSPCIKKWGQREPDHLLLFLFRFRFDSGEELDFALNENLYGAIQVGERDILTLMDGAFLDFGNRFGEVLEEPPTPNKRIFI